MRNSSLEGDLFNKDCNLKNLTVPPLYFFNRAKPGIRQGRILGIIHDMIRQEYKKQEVARRNFLMACYLNKINNSMQTTTPKPSQTQTEITTTDSPDYIDFNTFIKTSNTTNTCNKQDVSHTDTNNPDMHRQKRQILAAIGGILGTNLGIFNQQEIHNIMNHGSTLETNQNLVINVAHFSNELDHLANVVNSLIAFNPALVYARLQAQFTTGHNPTTSTPMTPYPTPGHGPT